MTCAMHLHDPCDGDVAPRCALAFTWVPLCENHVVAWFARCVPFHDWSESERERWAAWAETRAHRQKHQETTP